jgi:hypothetical protein
MGGAVRNAYWLAALAVALAAIFGLAMDARRIRGELTTAQEAAKTAQAALKRVERATALREVKRAATDSAAASAAARLETALAAERPWAEQPVPKEVQDALAP